MPTNLGSRASVDSTSTPETPSQDGNPPHAAPAPHRLPRLNFAIWFPVAVFVVTRLIDALFIVVAARHQIALSGVIDGYHATVSSPAAPAYTTVASNWDGQWYLRIAGHGYPTTLPRDPDGNVVPSEWAFYPFYPLLVSAAMRISGLGFMVVAPILSFFLGAAAVIAIFRLVNQAAGRYAASATVVLVCTYMAAPVMQIGYTESLALFLVCTALLLLRSRRYGWLAPVLVALALTRGVALAFVPVLVVHGISRYRRRFIEPFPGLDRWRVVGLTCVAVAVTGLWPAIAAITTGDRAAYTQTSASWGGANAKLRVFSALPVFAAAPHGTVVLVVLSCAIVLTGWLVLRTGAGAWGPEVRAWAGFYPLYLLLVTAPSSSSIRLLFLAFPLMWPFPEEVTSTSDRRRRTCFVAILAICGLATQWVWISEFLVVAGPPGERAFP